MVTRMQPTISWTRQWHCPYVVSYRSGDVQDQMHLQRRIASSSATISMVHLLTDPSSSYFIQASFIRRWQGLTFLAYITAVIEMKWFYQAVCWAPQSQSCCRSFELKY